MIKRSYVLPSGKSHIRFTLDPARLLGVIKKGTPATAGVTALLARSLARPVFSQNLKKICASKKRILIVVPDGTRSAHLAEMMPVVLRHISASRRKVDIMIALGLHKKHTPPQLRQLFGSAMNASCSVLHHSQRGGDLADYGTTDGGIPITLNKCLQRYDCIISIGVIEPHLYAGYSGGAKTIAIGLAGEKTISATHSMRFLEDPRTRLGSIEENPFQKVLWDIVRQVRVDFAINVVNDADGRAIGVFSGNVGSVFRRGVAFARSRFEATVPEPADIAICGVGYPKDVNLYQASRAINYILNVDRPIVRPGGVVIVVAGLRDGVGEGVSEKRFYEMLRRIDSPRQFIRRLKRRGFGAGEHRAYMVAKPMTRYHIIFVAPPSKGFMRHVPMPSFATVPQAIRHAESIIGKKATVYIVPRSLATIARVA